MPATKRKAPSSRDTRTRHRKATKAEQAHCLLDFPAEILLAITEFLPLGGLHHLCLTNRRFFNLLEPVLYSRDCAGEWASCLLWAVVHNKPVTVAKAMDAGAKPDGYSPGFPGGVALLEERRLGSATRYNNVPVMFSDQTPLFIAAFLGNLDMVKLLMGHGASPGWVSPSDMYPMTPASVAAAKGYVHILQYMHESGYALNKDRCHHGPILHCAIRHLRRKVVEFLIKTAKSDLFETGPTGLNALSKAIDNDAVTIFKFIMQQTPSKSTSISAALRQAIRLRSYKYFNILIESKKLNVNDKNDNDETLISEAIRGEVSWFVYELIKHPEFDPDLDSNGEIPLLQAIRTPGFNCKILEVLLSSDKISLESKCAVGEGLYVEVIRHGICCNAAELLLKGRLAGDDHVSHFQLASENSRHLIMKTLVEDFGVPVDTLTPGGQTAFQQAFLRNKYDVMGTLCKLGADTSRIGRDNLPMLHCAARDGPVVMLRALLSSGADPNLIVKSTGDTALHFACEQGNMDRITTLSNAGGDLMRCNDGGLTPYHLAVRTGKVKLIKWLLSGRRHPDPLLQNGHTLLHEACEAGKLEIAKFLVNRGATLTSKNSNGETALHLAAANDRVEIVQLLVAKGADVGAKAKNGSTAISIAADSQNMEIRAVIRGVAEDAQLIPMTPPMITNKRGGNGKAL